jgi:SM-20-related protein
MNGQARAGNQAGDGGIHCEALRLGPTGRRLFVLDHVLDAPAARKIHRYFKGLPVTLSDSDRPDTAHVKHLKHDFSEDEWQGNPALALLSGLARTFLDQHRLSCGEIYRIYANFNLHGDFQFAHEDGAGWTALAFINSRWGEDWGGELIFYPDGNSAYAYCVAPRPGRMVVFDGMLRHRGGAPSKLYLEARISLAIKFRPGNTNRFRRRSSGGHASVPR